MEFRPFEVKIETGDFSYTIKTNGEFQYFAVARNYFASKFRFIHIEAYKKIKNILGFFPFVKSVDGIFHYDPDLSEKPLGDYLKNKISIVYTEVYGVKIASAFINAMSKVVKTETGEYKFPELPDRLKYRFTKTIQSLGMAGRVISLELPDLLVLEYLGFPCDNLVSELDHLKPRVSTVRGEDEALAGLRLNLAYLIHGDQLLEDTASNRASTGHPFEEGKYQYLYVRNNIEKLTAEDCQCITDEDIEKYSLFRIELSTYGSKILTPFQIRMFTYLLNVNKQP
jgi:hypothetical protein